MFKNRLSTESRARLDAETAELHRLFSLTDEGLAHALLRLTQMAHQAPIAATSYAACLIYEVIPEISRRLGVLGPLPLKQGDEILRAKTAYQLRLLTGNCLHNISDFHLPGWDLLTHDPVNGNPVVYAIDRLCPGVLGDKEDILVTRMTEVARYRNVAYNGAWTPAILQYA